VHDYLLSSEWVRFAFMVGIAVSMLLYERRHLTTGSIVVPGYIAVFMIQPLVLVATFLNAFVTYAFVNKVLRRRVLLYGRTKFTVLALASTIIQTAMLRLSPSGHWLWESDIPLFVGVGYIVPALIAHDMARQGVAKTTKSVFLAGAIVAVPIGVALAIDLPGVNDLSPIRGFGTLAFPVQWLPVAIVISIGASWAIDRNYRCRSGGFIGAAFIGMFIADLWQVVAALAIAAITYGVVAKVLMRHMILFGRRKFSAMLLISSAIAWPALWIGGRILGSSLSDHLAVGSLALTPLLLPGLVANDMQRTSPARVAFGLSLASVCAVSVTRSIEAAMTGGEIHVAWRLVAIATVVVLTWPQLRSMATRSARSAPSRVHALVRLGSSIRLRAQLATISRRVVASGMRRQGTITGWVCLARERFVQVTSPARPMVALASVGGVVIPNPAPSAQPGATWRVWARLHPGLAEEAEAWLDAALAAPPSQPAPTAPSAGAPRAPSQLEDVTANILRGSLGVRAVTAMGFSPPAPGRRDDHGRPVSESMPAGLPVARVRHDEPGAPVLEPRRHDTGASDAEPDVRPRTDLDAIGAAADGIAT
jgi:poly-gamma-glutamate biosynthesis protein PgsC/CapC